MASTSDIIAAAAGATPETAGLYFAYQNKSNLIGGSLIAVAVILILVTILLLHYGHEKSGLIVGFVGAALGAGGWYIIHRHREKMQEALLEEENE